MRSASGNDGDNRGIPPGRGPYDVGCGDVMTNSTSPCVLYRLFYPIDRSISGIPANERPPWLLSDDYAQGLARVGGMKRAGGLVKRMLAKIKLPVRWHGQLSRAKPKWPVVIFSHGLGAFRSAYSSTCIDIASCGCVVAAVEHRENSACFSFKTKQSAGSDDVTMGGVPEQSPIYEGIDFIKAPYELQELRIRQITQRRDECIAALDSLELVNEGLKIDTDLDKEFDIEQFHGRLDTSDVGMCGHSYGAATCIVTLSKETRFKCGVACDPWGYPLRLDKSFRDVTQPLLIINTEKFQFRDNLRPVLQLTPELKATTGPRQMITIRGTVHLSQSDMSLVFPSAIARLLGMRDRLHPRVAMDTNNMAAISFLSKYIGLELGESMRGYDASRDPNVMIGHNVNMDPWWLRIGNRKSRKVGSNVKRKEKDIDSGMKCDLVACEFD